MKRRKNFPIRTELSIKQSGRLGVRYASIFKGNGANTMSVYSKENFTSYGNDIRIQGHSAPS